MAGFSPATTNPKLCIDCKYMYKSFWHPVPKCSNPHVVSISGVDGKPVTTFCSTERDYTGGSCPEGLFWEPK